MEAVNWKYILLRKDKVLFPRTTVFYCSNNGILLTKVVYLQIFLLQNCFAMRHWLLKCINLPFIITRVPHKAMCPVTMHQQKIVRHQGYSWKKKNFA